MFDFIWNITLICAWDCTFCCTDASKVLIRDGKIITLENSLKNSYVSDISHGEDLLVEAKNLNIILNSYDKAVLGRQARGEELTYAQKKLVLDNIGNINASIDFAGGDPLSCLENFLIIKKASEIFGKESVSITSTAHSIKRYGVDVIASIIGEYEFTFDEPYEMQPKNRPRGYNATNISAAEAFSIAGIKTKCQIPIHTGNFDKEIILSLYSKLSDAGVDEILLMRTFPVGRGGEFLKENGYLTQNEIRRTIDFYKDLSEIHSGPKIRLQCALKALYASSTEENPCDMMRKSYGIDPKGNLLLSAWATSNGSGKLLDDMFSLGYLHKEKFTNLVSSPHALALKNRLNENFGHCKIFSFLHSKKHGLDRIFDSSDPLYS